MTRYRRPVAVLLISLALLPAGLVGAQDTSRKLRELQQELEQQRELGDAQREKLEALQREIAALSEQQREVLGLIEELGEEVAQLERQSRELQDRITGVQDGISSLEGQIAVVSARVERLKVSVRALMRSLYQEHSGRYLQLLAQADSLPDLLIRARYANMLGTQNVDLVKSLKAQTEQLGQLREQQLSLKAQLEGLQVQLEGKLAQLRDRQAEQQALLNDLQRTEEGQRALAVQTRAQQQVTARNIDSLVGGIVRERARLEAERKAREEAERRRREEEARRLREEQERLRRERERLAQLAREREAAQRAAALQAQERARREQQAREAREAQDRLEREQQAVDARQEQLEQQERTAVVQSSPLPTAVGRLSVPLSGGRVSVPFGTEGGWMVLQSVEGAEVTAAADGNVIAETSFANEGWVVIVAHTPTLYTIYSGLQRPSVAVGTRVARGQQLGFAGGSPLYGPDSMKFQVAVEQNGAVRYVRPEF